MKKLNLLLFFIGFGVFLNAQSAFRVKVVDSETKDGIDKALVFIEEISVPDQETDEFGVVSYQNIPENLKIKISVRKKGYIPLKVDVVASRSISVYNNKVVELQKEPTVPQIIIYGEVTDLNGGEVKGVTVEISILGRPYKDVTDESGNYQIKIDGEVAKLISSFKIEAKKLGYEKFSSNLPKQDIINKDIKLVYIETKPIQEKTKPEPTPDEIRKAKEEKDRILKEQQEKAEEQKIKNEEIKQKERSDALWKTKSYINSIIDNNHSGIFSDRDYSGYTEDKLGYGINMIEGIRFTSYFNYGGKSRDSYNDRYSDWVAFDLMYIDRILKTTCENGYCGIQFVCINSNCITIFTHFNYTKKQSSFTLKVKCSESTQQNLLDAFLKYKRLVEEK